MAWEIVFMLLILKIPIVYLCLVVWWAIKAEPLPPELAGIAVMADTPPAGGLPRRQRVDLVVMSGKAQCEPFLALAAEFRQPM